ncbi:MAG TPA: glycosyltransferase [Thermoanaerobaculia bacterium]|jgi:glycosyltransferase involved in cell wall biosynthesis|nr:glycosyltransferase [Thermoanaerobaculia bacterium]
MRVAYLVPESRISGGQRVVFQQAEELARRGVEVAIVAPSPPPDWFPLRGASWEQGFGGSKALAQADVRIATFWTTVAPALEGAEVPVFHLCQGYEADFSFYRAQHAAIRNAYAQRTRKLAIAPHLAARLREEGHEAALIGQAFDADEFPPPVSRTDSARVPEILLVGPYEADVKGIPEALQALKALREEGAAFRLRRISTIAQSEDEASLGLAGSYSTNLGTAEMLKAYQGADLLIGPSHPEEGFGLPVLEALSTGLPVALADTPGHRHIARGAAAYFRCGDAGAIRVCVARLLESPAERSLLSRAGPEEAKRFRTAAVVDRLLEEFQKALALPSAPPGRR